jgi:transcriptional regulator with XRE-family HTH domain
MQKKITEELFNELKEIEKIEIYLQENCAEMTNRPFCEQLAGLLREKGLEKSAVIADSGLNVTYAYQIFEGKRNPSRDKVIALAFGFKSSLAEMQRMLHCSENAGLYPRDKRDSAVIFCVNKRYGLMELNEILYELQLPLLEQRD